MDIRNRGNYASIEAVWAAIPDGGVEGDYLFIPNVQGTKYRWNKYIQKWENAEVVTETTGREQTTFSDLNVQNELRVAGNGEVHGNLTVRGSLRASHVKQPCVGMFATLSALQAAYPHPEVGMWAVIGDSVPGYIYRCDTEGVWSATGETGGVDELENVLLYSAQELTEAEKKQARENIGVNIYDPFDVSAKYPTSGVSGGNTYTLAGALSVIESKYKNGGMTIKFIDSVTSKYVSYFYRNSSISGFTTESNWQGVDEEPTVGSHNLVESGGVYRQQINQDSLIGKHKTIITKVGRVSQLIPVDYKGELTINVSVISGEAYGGVDGDYVIFKNDSGDIGGIIASHLTFGDDHVITIPNDTNGFFLFTYSTVEVERTFEVSIEFSDSMLSKFPIIDEKINTLDASIKRIDGILESETVNIAAGSRLEKYISLSSNYGDTVKVNLSKQTGTGGTYNIYKVKDDGTLDGTLLDDLAYDKDYMFTIPNNGRLYFFSGSSGVGTEGNTIYINISLYDTIYEDVKLLKDNSLGYEYLLDTYAHKLNGRVSRSFYIGHPGEFVIVKTSVKTGLTAGGWRIYQSSDDGTSIVTPSLTVGQLFGNSAVIKVPENGYIWFWTSSNDSKTDPQTLTEYHIEVKKSINYRLNPLCGETIVSFGDSLTAFSGENGFRYSDYISGLASCNVVNAGIGGTQFRQRLTPILNPVGSQECYAALDMVNLVKAVTTNDFSYVDPAVARLAEISQYDHTQKIAALKAVDWSKVKYVTIFAGTNDWRNNDGNTGTIDSHDVNTTLGAINEIIRMLLSTYKHLKIYWFTPTVRVVNPSGFSDTVQYQINDFCMYNGSPYQFINAHIGAWNPNDVQQTDMTAFRNSTYFSDNATSNGLTLKEFSALIFNTVVSNHLPIYDFYNNLGWNLYNFSQYFEDNDNTHPIKGFEYIAEKMIGFITSN